MVCLQDIFGVGLYLDYIVRLVQLAVVMAVVMAEAVDSIYKYLDPPKYLSHQQFHMIRDLVDLCKNV
jgi:hypothetical protein